MKQEVKATKARKSRANHEKVEPGSGNVFVDIGFRDAEERLLKVKLATKIAQLIEEKGWNQTQTAERIGLDQPKVSHLLSVPLETSHTLTVESMCLTDRGSPLPLARVVPSGLKATELTTSECPLRVRNSVPVETSHSFMVLSQLPLARVFPSGLKATEATRSECPVCGTNSGGLGDGAAFWTSEASGDLYSPQAVTGGRQSIVKNATTIQCASQFVRVPLVMILSSPKIRSHQIMDQKKQQLQTA